jgi:hypothetical protein
MGQIKQESNCRTNVTAFDGGMGLTQFMPATASDISKKMGGGYNAYNPDHAIKMQAYYMWELHRKNWDGALWLTYSFYNSGFVTMKREWIRTGKEETDYFAMKDVCKRKVLTLKNGSQLDLCDVGYDYSQRIYKYGQLYKQGSDGMGYWKVNKEEVKKKDEPVTQPDEKPIVFKKKIEQPKQEDLNWLKKTWKLIWRT